jgi:RHS repeat-associated protein
VQTFGVNNKNELTNATHSGTLTVAGLASEPRGGDQWWGYPPGVSNVVVSGTGLSSGNAALYADGAWARTNATLADGNNSYTATAYDTFGRTASDSVTLSLPATVNFSYDGNGNLTNDGRRVFEYDYENQLTNVYVASAWKSVFQYDAFGRRRVRKEYGWSGSAWVLTNEVRYVYDAMFVVQERDGNNLALVSYTRGNDLSGSLQGAGGIGGLLARSETSNLQSPHAYYHADGNGNVTALVDTNGFIVARYQYDPYGNLLGMSGPLAEVNAYRFSSKEWHANAGFCYYGFRYYEPNLQRWLNQDPIQEWGGLNLYQFVLNDPGNWYDPYGLDGCGEFVDRLISDVQSYDRAKELGQYWLGKKETTLSDYSGFKPNSSSLSS